MLTKKQNNVCFWGSEVPYQCFGLGVERLHLNQRIESAELCETACCYSNKVNCEVYQYQPGRGCFFGESKNVWCGNKLEEVPEGGRKCLPGFCGGEELRILEKYKKKMAGGS